jgi:transposase
MLNGILWLTKTGVMWRDLPQRYGAYTTVYGWYKRWQEGGIIEKIFKDLSGDANLKNMSLDSTCAKVHQSAAGARKGAENGAESANNPDSLDIVSNTDSKSNAQKQAIGVSRGGRNTKIHAVVDAQGKPIHVHLSAGNVHDSKEAETCLNDVLVEGSMLIADKAYSSKKIKGADRKVWKFLLYPTEVQ